LAIFALQDIKRGTELCISYSGPKIKGSTLVSKIKEEDRTCFCGAEKCKKYMYNPAEPDIQN